MNHIFLKSNTSFLMGITNVSDLKTWLITHNTQPGLVFAGRSNVGKSTLLNSLFGKVARTSKTPGRTQQINIFECFVRTEGEPLVPFYIFDIPGYGHAKVSKDMHRNWESLLITLFTELDHKNLVVNLQDSRHPAQKVDVFFYDFLKKFQLRFFLVLNKFDKLRNQKSRNELKKKMPEIYKNFKDAEQVYTLSAESKKGVDKLEEGLINFVLDKNETPE